MNIPNKKKIKKYTKEILPLKKLLKKPLTKKPLTKKPLTKKVVNKKPLTKKPLTKKPLTKKVVNKKPLTKKVVNKKPLTKKVVNKALKRKTVMRGSNNLNKSPILFKIDNNSKNNQKIMSNLKVIQLGFSPKSGHEPKYDPDSWNSKPHIKDNHNCYSYALDDKYGKRKGKAQPGYYANYPPINLNEYNCNDIFKRIWKDNPSIYPTLFNNKCNKGYYKAFFTLSPKNHTDYHFYRQDKNGYWSHKPGRTDVTDKDADGKRIINPVHANRDYGGLNYYMPCQFFCLHPKMTRTHSKSSHNRF